MKRPKIKELKEQARKLVSEAENENWKENVLTFLKIIGGNL